MGFSPCYNKDQIQQTKGRNAYALKHILPFYLYYSGVLLTDCLVGPLAEDTAIERWLPVCGISEGEERQESDGQDHHHNCSRYHGTW